jgi:multiple sugar transport system substrate-binding protein
MKKISFIQKVVVSLLILIISLSGISFYRAQVIESVSILMPAPFADSTQELVKQFNRENRGKIRLKVIRGPLATDAMSDLAISSLLLGSTPFDGLLMDVTWLPKYAEAGWLEPLESFFDDVDVSLLAPGAGINIDTDSMT